MISFRGGARSAPIAALCGDPVRQGAGRAAPAAQRRAETTWRTGRPGKFASRGMRAAQGKFVGQAGCGEQARGAPQRSGSEEKGCRARARIHAQRQGRGSGPTPRKGPRAQATSTRQPPSGMGSAPPNAKPADQRVQGQGRTPRRIGPTAERKKAAAEKSAWHPACRRATVDHGDCALPASRTAPSRTTGCSKADRKPAHHTARRLARRHGQSPLESRSSNARGTPAARAAPRPQAEARDKTGKPRPKPGHRFTPWHALLRLRQAPRCPHPRQPRPALRRQPPPVA